MTGIGSAPMGNRRGGCIFAAMKPKVLFNWSGGKDSSLCLYRMLTEDRYTISGLLTSISEAHQRVSMHGVRKVLLERQAASIGLPLIPMMVPDSSSMDAYEQRMHQTLHPLREQGVHYSAFGDIFLEDLRAYREQQLERIGMKGLFPLWKQPTDQLIREFLALGFKTIVTCVNERYLDQRFVGRVIDESFLNELPEGVDPCGEHGEFHTFVYDGPIFRQPISFSKGEIVYRRYTPPDDEELPDDPNSPYHYGFWYIDLLPDA